MNNTTGQTPGITTTSGAADLRTTFSEMLVDLPNTEPFTLFKAGFDAALAAGQATAAQAVVPAGWKLVPVDATDEMVRATDEVNFENGDTDGTIHNVWHVMIAAAPAQPAAQQGAAYAELPDEGEPWRGHKFKEVQRGCWRCDCGKTIKEVTSDQSTPASDGNYPVMPKRYTVDDDGEELFTAEKMRAFADATHTLRASHGQAPAETGNSVSAQTDSVQEDAALLDWLEQNLFHREMDEWDVKFGGRGDQNMWVLFAPKGVQGSARRIINAAMNKGGA